VCVCVFEIERERESVCVCVCVTERENVCRIFIFREKVCRERECVCA